MITKYSFSLISFCSLVILLLTGPVSGVENKTCEETFQKKSHYTKNGDTRFISYTDPFSFYDKRFPRAEKLFSGRVRSIKEYCFVGTYDSQQILTLTESKYMAKPYRKKVPLNAEYEFDRLGRLTFYAYSVNYEMSSYKVQKKGYQYEYNNRGLVSRIYNATVDESGPYSTSGTTFTYDKSGQLKSIVKFDHDDKVEFINSDSMVFTYENDQLVELNYFENEDFFKSNMKLVKTRTGKLIETEYDQCQLVKEKVHTNALEPFPHEMEYLYEDQVLSSFKWTAYKNNYYDLGENIFTLFPNGIVKKHEQNLSDGTTTETTYDEKGDLLTLNGKLMGTYLSPDEEGNWLVRVLRDEEYLNKSPLHEWVVITKREIRYY